MSDKEDAITKNLLAELHQVDNEATSLDVTIQGMQMTEDKVIKLSVEKMRAAIKANPNHPLAAALTKGIRNLPPAYQVFVSRVDLQCILENKECVRNAETIIADGVQRTVFRKSIGKSLASRTPVRDADSETPVPSKFEQHRKKTS